MLSNNLHKHVEHCLTLALTGVRESLLHERDIRRVAVLNTLLQPLDGLAVAEALSRSTGASPNKNKALVWRAEAPTEKIVEGVQIAVPRHGEPEDTGKL